MGPGQLCSSLAPLLFLVLICIGACIASASTCTKQDTLNLAGHNTELRGNLDVLGGLAGEISIVDACSFMIRRTRYTGKRSVAFWWGKRTADSKEIQISQDLLALESEQPPQITVHLMEDVHWDDLSEIQARDMFSRAVMATADLPAAQNRPAEESANEPEQHHGSLLRDFLHDAITTSSSVLDHPDPESHKPSSSARLRKVATFLDGKLVSTQVSNNKGSGVKDLVGSREAAETTADTTSGHTSQRPIRAVSDIEWEEGDLDDALQ